MTASDLDRHGQAIHRYVRGQMSTEEAERFEERYFADDELASLVAAEQMLWRSSAFTPRAAATALPRTEPTIRPPALLPYAWAAGLLLALAIGWHLPSIPGPAHVAESGAAPVQVVQSVRLSTLRAAATERPDFRFALPASPTRAIQLVLPLPPSADAAPRVLKLVAQARPDEPFASYAVTPGGARMELSLPGGSLGVGRYQLVLEDAEPAEGPPVRARYAFEVLPGTD